MAEVTIKMVFLVALMTFLVSAVMAQNDADVLILGAGTAGLTAARHLFDKNVSFVIIEGDNDIGGRVKSKMFGGKMVELGPAVLYGTKERISAVVNKYNISGSYLDYESVIVRTSNNTMPEAQSETAWNRLEASQMKVKELYGKIKEGKIPDMSIRVALEYGNWFPKNPVDDVIEIYDYDYEFAKIPELISTYGWEIADPFFDTAYMPTGPEGLQGLFKTQASEFLDLDANDPRLKLNEVVDRISHNGSSVSVSTKSGKTFTGKYAIVTFSMGVLKSGSVTFEPALPEWKLDTIYKTSMDVYTQIYATFGQKFWDDYEFILHANARRGYYPIIVNMEADGLYPAGTNMISFNILGEEARRIERTNCDTIREEITEVLRNMYGPSIPEPEDILVTKWLDDPLTMGSFSSRQVGYNNPRFLEALNSPVGRLYFAGEAYHDAMGGFAEGARLSADASVMKLYECMKSRKCHRFDPNPTVTTPKPPVCGTAATLVPLFTLMASLTISFVESF